MRYSGSISRLIANILDLGILMPLTLVGLIISQKSLSYCVFISFVLSVLRNGYFIVSHKYFGQTIGKWLVGIRVVKSEYDYHIGWRDSLRRSGGDIVLTFLRILGLCSAFLEISKYPYDESAWIFMESRFRSLDPTFSWVGTLMLIWILSESFSLLFTARRQSLQDVFAGTHVISFGHRMTPLLLGAMLVFFANLLFFHRYSAIYRVEPNKAILIGSALQKSDLQKLVKGRVVGETEKVIWVHTNRNSHSSVVLTNDSLIRHNLGRTRKYSLRDVTRLERKYVFGGYLDLIIGTKDGRIISLRTLPNKFGRRLHKAIFLARNKRYPVSKTRSLGWFRQRNKRYQRKSL